MKAQKKPVIVDYFEVTQWDNFNPLVRWVESFSQEFQEHFYLEDGGKLMVKTLEGTSYEVTNEDVIIRGVKGEYYPCKKAIFELTYDKL